MQHHIPHIPDDQIRDLLRQCLEYLNEQNIKRLQIKQDLGISSSQWSKAIAPFGDNDFKIKGNTRQQLLEMLCRRYHIEVDITEGQAQLHTPDKVEQPTLHYIYYYWSNHDKLKKCLLTASKIWTLPRLVFYDSEMKVLQEIAAPKVEIHGGNLHLIFTDTTGSHSTSYNTFFIGTIPRHELYRIPWLFGTYSGARFQDAAPTSGVCVLQLTTDLPAAKAILQNQQDDPRIAEYLKGKTFKVRNFVVSADEYLYNVLED